MKPFCVAPLAPILALLFCCSSVVLGEDRLWKLSLVATAGASIADYSTSLGRVERNPLLRGNDGRFSPMRGLAWKIGPQSALVVAQAKTPRHRKVWTVVNFALAGVLTSVAVHNARAKP